MNHQANLHEMLKNEKKKKLSYLFLEFTPFGANQIQCVNVCMKVE